MSDNNEVARAIFDTVAYMVLATADADGVVTNGAGFRLYHARPTAIGFSALTTMCAYECSRDQARRAQNAQLPAVHRARRRTSRSRDRSPNCQNLATTSGSLPAQCPTEAMLRHRLRIAE